MLRLSDLFGEGCVLQRNKPVKIWGMSRPGAEVTVSVLEIRPESEPGSRLEGSGSVGGVVESRPGNRSTGTTSVSGTAECQSGNRSTGTRTVGESSESRPPATCDDGWTIRQSVRVDSSGAWEVLLEGIPAGGPYCMEVVSTAGVPDRTAAVDSASEQILRTEVYVGEVWLCAGQSNMELPMERVKDRFPEEMHQPDNPYIRQFKVNERYVFDRERQEVPEGKWTGYSAETVPEFSATAYFFGLRLYEHFHVPVGLINVSKGGSRIEAWMPEASLADRKDLLSAIDAEGLRKEGGPERFTEREEKAAWRWQEELRRLEEAVGYRRADGIPPQGNALQTAEFESQGNALQTAEFESQGSALQATEFGSQGSALQAAADSETQGSTAQTAEPEPQDNASQAAEFVLQGGGSQIAESGSQCGTAQIAESEPQDNASQTAEFVPQASTIQPAEAESAWMPLWLPGFLAEADEVLAGFCGSLLLRKRFNLPEGAKTQEAELRLGTLVDSDITWLNGEKVGETGYQYPPRKYKIRKGLLRTGQNEAIVCLTVSGGCGRVTPGKDICLVAADGSRLNLAGKWEYRILARCEKAPEMDFLCRKATGIFKGMVAPCIGYTVRGVLWYQGESNDFRPSDYGELLRRMIRSWRDRWKDELPFVIVQLPNFAIDLKKENSGWPEIREAQKQAEQLPRVAVTVNLGLGEDNDLHPLNKKGIADRAFLAARGLAYAEDICFRSPEPVAFRSDGAALRVRFDTGDGGALLSENGAVPEEFELAGEDGRWHRAVCVLDENEAVLTSADEEHPVSVRYAWSNAPGRGLLQNSAGILASPFRIG